MKAYIAYFKSEFLVGLQYKEAALAGLMTQFFWGILYAFIYEVFYGYTSVDSISLKQVMCYVWINQILYALVAPGVRDKKNSEDIKNGVVAYELCRPYDLYYWWFSKYLAKRYASFLLRCFPIILFALILPYPYNLSFPISLNAFILFLIATFLGTIITTGIAMILQTVTFFTYHDKGIYSFVYIIQALLQGFEIPIPLLPIILITISEFLPFRLINDLGARIYSGNISISYCLNSIVLQIIWIIILIIVGKLLMNHALKKVSIQGG